MVTVMPILIKKLISSFMGLFVTIHLIDGHHLSRKVVFQTMKVLFLTLQGLQVLILMILI